MYLFIYKNVVTPVSELTSTIFSSHSCNNGVCVENACVHARASVPRHIDIKHSHTRTHTHTHACTHTHTRTHTHTHTRACTHTHTHTLTFQQSNLHSQLTNESKEVNGSRTNKASYQWYLHWRSDNALLSSGWTAYITYKVFDGNSHNKTTFSHVIVVITIS